MFSPLLLRYRAVYCVFIASTIKYHFKYRKISTMTLDSGLGQHEDPSLAECLLIIVLLSPLTNLLSDDCLERLEPSLLQYIQTLSNVTQETLGELEVIKPCLTFFVKPLCPKQG